MGKEKGIDYKNTYYEINLIDLFWRLLYQWKAMLLFALIMAALVVCVRYRSDMRDYNNSINGLNQQSEDTDAESLKENYANEFGDRTAEILMGLDDTDRTPLYNLLRLESTLKTEKDYFSESLYLHIDPNHEKRMRVTYLIDGLDANGKKYIDILLREYQKGLDSDTFIEKVKKEISPDTDSEYIRQMVMFDNNNNYYYYGPSEKDGVDSFQVSIILPDTVEGTEGLEKVIADEMKGVCAELSRTVVPHTLKLFRSDVRIITDKDLLQQKNDWTVRISDLTTRIKNAKDALQGKQIKAYEMIKTGESEESSGETSEVWRELNDIREPSFEIKYAILGAVLAVFIYAVVYLLLMVKKGICYSSNTLEMMTGVRVIGRINLFERGSGLKRLFESPFFEKIRLGTKDSIEEQTEEAVAEIMAFCKYKEIAKIALIVDSGFGDEKLEDLKKRLASHEIDHVCYDYKTIHTDDFPDMEAAVLIVRENFTRLKPIKRIIKKMSFYNVENIGIIYYR